MIAPSSIAELSDALGRCHNRGEQVAELDLRRLNRLIAHTPADMTATAESGMTLGELQRELRKHGQWLPLDPPGADTLTLRELLDHDLSGPRRYGFGTARDWVIGLKAVLADGRVIHSGGNVVKNVAGYDLHKLLIGARGELGVIVEATFKVSPAPQCELLLQTSCADLTEADQLLTAIGNSPVAPVVLDLRRLESLTLLLGFAGTPTEVDWQRSAMPSPERWTVTVAEKLDVAFALPARAWSRLSVPPTSLTNAAENIPAGEPWLARAGNGLLLRPTVPRATRERSPLELRIKSRFDPRNILSAPNPA